MPLEQMLAEGSRALLDSPRRQPGRCHRPLRRPPAVPRQRPRPRSRHRAHRLARPLAGDRAAYRRRSRRRHHRPGAHRPRPAHRNRLGRPAAVGRRRGPRSRRRCSARRRSAGCSRSTPYRKAWRSASTGSTAASCGGCCRTRCRGIEHLPGNLPFLMTPNHTSFLDPLALAGLQPAAPHLLGPRPPSSSPAHRDGRRPHWRRWSPSIRGKVRPPASPLAPLSYSTSGRWCGSPRGAVPRMDRCSRSCRGWASSGTLPGAGRAGRHRGRLRRLGHARGRCRGWPRSRSASTRRSIQRGWSGGGRARRRLEHIVNALHRHLEGLIGDAGSGARRCVALSQS